MTDFSQLAADYLAGQAERDATADVEIAAMKALLLLHFKAHGIATVEIRFDGYGDSGAIERQGGRWWRAGNIGVLSWQGCGANGERVGVRRAKRSRATAPTVVVKP